MFNRWSKVFGGTLVFILILAGCSMFDSSAKTGTIVGVVEDQDGQKVADAEVRLNGKSTVATEVTTSEGTFEFADVAHGAYTLTVHDGDGNVIGQEQVVVDKDSVQVTIIVADGPVFENLVSNAGFEDQREDRDFPAIWGTSVFDESDVTFHSDSTVVRTGNFSVRIDGRQKEGVNRGPRGSVNQLVELTDMEPGAVYRISGWYRTAHMTKVEAVDMRLRVRDEEKKDIILTPDNILYPEPERYKIEAQLNHTYPESLAEGEWNEHYVLLKMPDNAATLNIELFLYRDAGIGGEGMPEVGSLWWDDIEVVRVQ